MKSFHLICNMPMFLEENFRSFWKSPQVFRSHLKSFGSQKSVNSCFNPNVHLSSFQTKKKLASQPYFQYQNNCFKVFLPQPSKCPPPFVIIHSGSFCRVEQCIRWVNFLCPKYQKNSIQVHRACAQQNENEYFLIPAQ